MERLDKLLAGSGRFTRKEAKELLKKGAVTVDGVLVKEGATKFPLTAQISVQGSPLLTSQPLWIMLHKPQGYVTATQDRDQPTVMDLLPQEFRSRGLFPVGRLDKDTEGLLFFTENGPWAHNLLSPSHHVEKTYFAQVKSPLSQDDVEAFAQGLILGDGLHCLPAKLELLEDKTTVHITLTQGKFHQIKRMLASRNAPVTYLKRVSFAGISLDNSLKLGEWRHLTPGEIDKLSQKNQR